MHLGNVLPERAGVFTTNLAAFQVLPLMVAFSMTLSLSLGLESLWALSAYENPSSPVLVEDVLLVLLP